MKGFELQAINCHRDFWRKSREVLKFDKINTKFPILLFDIMIFCLMQVRQYQFPQSSSPNASLPTTNYKLVKQP